ncbi:MAG TPA: glycosyltransferase [Pyrinomonadaceae bacterium]|nr:glycosyltransferase [Pyrinomonadaceae bacterium]
MSTASQPLVSVIIPSYNYARFIAEAVAGVHSQTYSNWEIIIVDDGSTDNTEEIVKGLAADEPRISYLRQENARQAAARNNGIAHARGDYFQFLDADDSIEPQKLEQQVAFLEQHPDVNITYSGVRYFSSQRAGELLLSRQYSSWEDSGAWMPEISGQGKEILLALLRNNIMVVNAPLIRREVIDRVGLFDVDLTPVEDWEYLIRCAAAGAVFSFNDLEGARALVRAHGDSSSLNQPRYLRSVLKMRKKIARLNLDAEALELNRQKVAETEGHLGIEEVAHGKLGSGISQMLKAALKDPRFRFRAKWLICAASAPFVSGDRLKRMVTSSLSRPIKGVRPSQA